jgi:hypothetical protein
MMYTVIACRLIQIRRVVCSPSVLDSNQIQQDLMECVHYRIIPDTIGQLKVRGFSYLLANENVGFQLSSACPRFFSLVRQ